MLVAADEQVRTGRDVCPAGVLTAVVVVVAILAYLPALGHGFVFDDLSLIGPDGPKALGNGWLPYRPLRLASLWLDHSLFGAAAWGYHLTNMVLHAAVAALLHRLALRLGATALAATLGALAFALHPLAVESVAYVSGRRDLLALLFGTAALWFWSASPVRNLCALAMLLAAVASKESGLLACGVLALASFMRPGPGPQRAWQVLGPAAAAGLALTLAYGARGPLLPVDALDALAAMGGLCVHYLSGLLALRPLAADYPGLHSVEVSVPAVASGLCLLTLCGAGLGRVLLRGRLGPPGFVVLWLLFELLVLSGLVGMHEPGADRHAYRLLLPTALGLAFLLDHVVRARLLCSVALLLFVALLAAKTSERVPVWSDSWSLWSSTVVEMPGSVRAHYNLGAMLAEAGAMGHAREHLRTALGLDPGHEPARLGLARMACILGHPRRARSLAGGPICEPRG